MVALKRAVFLSLYDCFFLSSDCFYHFALTFLGSCSSPRLFHIFPFILLSSLCSCHQCAVFYIDFRVFFFVVVVFFLSLRFPHFFFFFFLLFYITSNVILFLAGFIALSYFAHFDINWSLHRCW